MQKGFPSFELTSTSDNKGVKPIFKDKIDNEDALLNQLQPKINKICGSNIITDFASKIIEAEVYKMLKYFIAEGKLYKDTDDKWIFLK